MLPSHGVGAWKLKEDEAAPSPAKGSVGAQPSPLVSPQPEKLLPLVMGSHAPPSDIPPFPCLRRAPSLDLGHGSPICSLRRRRGAPAPSPAPASSPISDRHPLREASPQMDAPPPANGSSPPPPPPPPPPPFPLGARNPQRYDPSASDLPERGVLFFYSFLGLGLERERGSCPGLLEPTLREADVTLMKDGSTEIPNPDLEKDVANHRNLSAAPSCAEGWSEGELSKLYHFSKVLGMPVEGHEVEILALLKKFKLRTGSRTFNKRRKKKKACITRFERELKDWNTLLAMGGHQG
ncbi:hypothetical protein CK203_077540 [Vitis vinifera]|uniref:Uncharacterized protein n=1 Tax=Vitis vinifera TaxID=29760 RepID=A0A438DT18_VITVI|nr:hypothetical protein CK203_077540 [Vitis vinifera]